MADTDTISNTEPSVPIAAGLSKIAGGVDQALSKPFGFDNPPGAIVSDLLGFPSLSKMLDHVAYGTTRLTDNTARGREQRMDLVNSLPLASGAAKLAGKAAWSLAGKVAKVPAGQTNMFLGPSSKTADLGMLERAKSLREEGFTPEDVHLDTGWMKGPDGKWRYEIADNKASLDKTDWKREAAERQLRWIDEAKRVKSGELKKNQVNPIAAKYADNHSNDELDWIYAQHSVAANAPRETTLGQALDHPELFKAYPELSAMPLKIGGMEGSRARGEYQPPSSSIRAAGGPNAQGSIALQNESGASTLLHEVQHAVQHREGFDPGGSPSHAKEIRNAPAREAQRDLQIADTAVSYRRILDDHPGIDPEEAYKMLVDRRLYRGDAPEDNVRKYLITHVSKSKTEAMENLSRDARAEYESKAKSVITNTEAHDLYMRNMGEAEARTTQARQYLSQGERDLRFPMRDYDRDPKTLITNKQLYDSNTPVNAPSEATLYHSSPHEFENFDSAHIGKGEGAQSYGQGLYFTDSKGVRDHYARQFTTSPPYELTYGGEKIKHPAQAGKGVEDYFDTYSIASGEKTLGSPEKDIRAMLEARVSPGHTLRSSLSTGQLRRELLNDIKAREHTLTYLKESDPVVAERRKSISLLKERVAFLEQNPGIVKSSVVAGESRKTASVYSTEYPDEKIANMLHWDKKFAEQSETVKIAIEKILPDLSLEELNSKKGKDLYLAIADKYGSRSKKAQLMASQDLKEAGIPGHKYKSSGSRTSEDKIRHNYVIYPGEEAAVQILDRSLYSRNKK